MIGQLTVNISAKDPTRKCETFRAFVGSPSNVRIVDVPTALGNWKIQTVYFTVNYPDNRSVSKTCKAGVGVYVATIEGSTLPGKSLLGYTVKADGVDENNQPVIGYVLGKGDVEIVDADATITPGETTHYIHVLESRPDNPRKGDAYVENGTWRFYNGSVWTVLGGVSAGNSYVMSPADKGGDGLWHRMVIVDGTIAYEREGVAEPPLAADKPWVLTKIGDAVSSEETRAKAAEQAKVPTDGNHTINGVKTFTQSPLVPTVQSTADNSQKTASTGWVTGKLASWWSAICAAAVTFSGHLTASGGISGNLTGNVTGTASGNLPLNGGTITGTIRRAANLNWAIVGSNTTTQTRILGGQSENDGANIVLSGQDHESEPGLFKLNARITGVQHTFTGYPNGSLKWDGNEIVRENIVPHNSAIASIAFPSDNSGAVSSAFSAIENDQRFTAPVSGWIKIACQMSLNSRLSIQGGGGTYWSAYSPVNGGVIGTTLPILKGQTAILVIDGTVQTTYFNHFYAAKGEVY